MVDFVKIILKTQEGTEVILGSKKHFDNAYLACQIMDFEKVHPEEIKLFIADNVVNGQMAYLAKSIYLFYNGLKPRNSVSLHHFSKREIHLILKSILERIAFLKSSQITHLEFGFSLEHFTSRKKIDYITQELFKESKVELISTTTSSEINSSHNQESIYSAFSIKINLSSVFKKQLIS